MSSQWQTVSSLFTVRVSKAFTMGQNVVLGLQRSIQRRNEHCTINENSNEKHGIKWSFHNLELSYMKMFSTSLG